MESEAAMAVIESLRMVNSTLDKIVERLEVLESDFQERYFKRRFFKWLISLYPFAIISLIWFVDVDHKKIAEIAGDINELINDTKTISLIAQESDPDRAF